MAANLAANLATSPAVHQRFAEMLVEEMEGAHEAFISMMNGPEALDRYRAEKARLAEGRIVCAATGAHVWGAIERRGGICSSCDGDGLAHGQEYGQPWDDCPSCDGLGHVATTYSRCCERCGTTETKST